MFGEETDMASLRQSDTCSHDLQLLILSGTKWRLKLDPLCFAFAMWLPFEDLARTARGHARDRVNSPPHVSKW
jgi:hypothetical protein